MKKTLLNKLFNKSANTALCKKQRRNILWTNYLQPHIYSNESYISLANSPNLPNRDATFALLKPQDPDNFQLFTNQLANNFYCKPKDRVQTKDFWVMTYEHDVDDLETQIAWTIGPKGQNCLDSNIGRLYSDLLQFMEFEGITVNWSGNKSCHIHIVISHELTHFRFRKIFTAQQNRFAYIELWYRLSTYIKKHCPITALCKKQSRNANPDESLSRPEAYRRLPSGTRYADKDNLLVKNGYVPEGTLLTQTILWEKYRKNRSVNSTFILNESDFYDKQCSPIEESSASLPYDNDEVTYLEECMRNQVRQLIGAKTDEPAYPEFIRFEQDGSDVKAYFRLCDADINPSSIIKGNYKTILKQTGHTLSDKDRNGLYRLRLPESLNALVSKWRKNYKRLPLHEKAFRKVRSLDQSRNVISETILEYSRFASHLVINAPEGASKTRSVFEQLSEIYCDLKGSNESKGEYIMFAFDNYAAVEEKAKEFQSIKHDVNFKPVILESFTKVYNRLCAEHGETAMDMDALVHVGIPCIYQAIRLAQPSVFAALRAHHDAVWQDIEDPSTVTVFFTVHDVLQNWSNIRNRTRRLYIKGMFEALGKNIDFNTFISNLESDRVGDTLRLLFALHDEVSIDDHTTIVSELDFSVYKLFIESPIYKGLLNKDRISRYNAFKNWNKLFPNYTFEWFEAMQNSDINESHKLIVNPATDYVQVGQGGHNSWTNDIETVWYAIKRDWYKNVADLLVITTTESLQNAILNKCGFLVLNFTRDTTASDGTIVVCPKKFTTTTVKRQEFLDKLLDQYKLSYIVTNGAGNNCTTATHSRVKGSNSYLNENIGQTQLTMPPIQFKQLFVLKSLYGVENPHILYHIDVINQTAGRNLGFRHNGCKHYLFIPHHLWATIENYMKVMCRYPYQLETKRK